MVYKTDLSSQKKQIRSSSSSPGARSQPNETEKKETRLPQGPV